MMKWVFSSMVVVSLLFAAMSGNTAELSSAVISECEAAVTLILTLAGIICLWTGIMRVAEKSGLVSLLAKAFSPLLGLLFRGLDKNGRAMRYIVLNLTANLLGLGNASTPFGIAAVRELEKEEKTGFSASDNMVTFIVMNTASLQLIPTTTAALRLVAGSSEPLAILPAVWAVSAALLIVTVAASKLFSRLFRKKEGV